ncbi:50S ribosomal protein L30 [Blochmannia endosymbiont of Camponotus modoc]|uniref:50S ribosomal protein L30 n=1 Tax=Blochmannia endosymbiont of Camponotus modoc TaxID=2945587 RepID=UPI002023EE62|nr:50S ribosomal protein L30 [Blochmannia endosymbiont of Camponotus modoc]URJ26557.1 50S ribosomal protein L30 [Blochmannia endosymbiont of Camponotus modoc]
MLNIINLIQIRALSENLYPKHKNFVWWVEQGLRHIKNTVEIIDAPAIRGMINLN